MPVYVYMHRLHFEGYTKLLIVINSEMVTLGMEVSVGETYREVC